MIPTLPVSLIVPFRNVARHLGAFLDSVASQTGELDVEVVLVDNGSTDGSTEIAERRRHSLPMTLLRATDKANASYARNVGARVSGRPWLMFADADDELAPGYLSALARALNVHEYVTSQLDSLALNADWLSDAHGPHSQVDGLDIYFGFLPATGVNIGVHRSLFERVGGFPEEYSGSQDIAFSWRAQLAGAQIHFVREAVYRYRFRETLLDLFRQTRNYGRSNVLLYKEFQRAGMPSRSWREVAIEWLSIAQGLAVDRRPAARARSVVRLGYCLGRIQGALEYHTLYL